MKNNGKGWKKWKKVKYIEQSCKILKKVEQSQKSWCIHPFERLEDSISLCGYHLFHPYILSWLSKNIFNKPEHRLTHSQAPIKTFELLNLDPNLIEQNKHLFTMLSLYGSMSSMMLNSWSHEHPPESGRVSDKVIFLLKIANLVLYIYWSQWTSLISVTKRTSSAYSSSNAPIGPFQSWFWA